MLEILKYIFSGFWVFIGFVILLTIVGLVIEGIVVNICRTIIGCRSAKYSKDNDIKIE